MDIINDRKCCRESGNKTNLQTNVRDEPDRARPCVSDETVSKDRRLTVRKTGEMILDISKTNVDKTLPENLGYHKVCARYVC